MRSFTGRAIIAAVSVLAVLSAACGNNAPSADAPSTPVPSESADLSAADVQATVKDFGISLAPTTVTSGEVTFAITNEGPSVHEFVVVKTDLAADALPVEGQEVTEDALDAIGEAEDIQSGATSNLSLNLDPGSYVAICNIAEHYGLGMRVSLTVS